jgi:hypothetical protein
VERLSLTLMVVNILLVATASPHFQILRRAYHTTPFNPTKTRTDVLLPYCDWVNWGWLKSNGNTGLFA